MHPLVPLAQPRFEMTTRLHGLLLLLLLLGAGCRSQQPPPVRADPALDSLQSRVIRLEAERQVFAEEQARLEAEQARLAAELQAALDSLAALAAFNKTARAAAETRYANRADSLRQAYVLLFHQGMERQGVLRGRTLDVILFPSGSTGLPPAVTARLDRVAARLRRLPPSSRLLVEGHTDDQPPAGGNNRLLSAERAAAVARYLIDRHGIDARRCETAGFGPDRPLAPNDTPEGRRLNRRVRLALVE